MSQATDFFMIMGALILFVLILMSMINWLSRGFWWSWLSVRISRGKKWLIRVWTQTGTYYTTGVSDGEILKWKDKNKQSRTIQLQEGTTYKSFGVDNLEVDETTNGVRVVESEKESMPGGAVRVKGAFFVVPGFDAVTFDSMIQRAFELGRSARQNKEKIIILLLLLALAVGALNAYFNYTIYEQVKNIVIANAGGVI